MIRLFFICISFTTILLSQDSNNQVEINNSFITKYEYGKMLYNNPRGIGCNSCHGDNASGKKIVSFTHTYRKKKYECDLIVPSITNIEHEKFVKKINSKKNVKKKFSKDQVCEKLIYYSNIMPTYFLVKEEINAIYYYVQNLNK